MATDGRSERTCESKRGATFMSKCRIFDPTNGNFWEWSACRLNREIRRGMAVPLQELVPAAPSNLMIYAKLPPHCTRGERLHIAELAAQWWDAALQASAKAARRARRRPRRTSGYGHVVPRRPKRTRLNAHGWGFAEVGCAAVSSEQERAIENLAFAGDIKKGD